MKLEINQILKASFKNYDLITRIPTECLDAYQFRICSEIEKQLQANVDATLQSVARSIADELKPELKPEFLKLIKAIHDASDIDTATQTLQLQAARTIAISKTVKLLAVLDDEAHKEKVQLYKRLDELRETSIEYFAKPISAKDYTALQKLEQEQVTLAIDWFTKNGVTINSKVVYAIITMTNGGKTIIKTWLAFELIKQGQNILFLAQEEPYQDTIRRIHQMALGLSEDQYTMITKEGFDVVGQQYNKVAEARGYGDIYVVEWSAITTRDLKQQIEKLEKEEATRIHGVVIDYAKLIDTKTKTSQEWERIGKVFQEIKTLAMEMNKYFITSIQLNREASQKMMRQGQTPDITDVAGAYEAVQHVNYAIAAKLTISDLRDEVMTDQTILGSFELSIQKQKYGRLKTGDSKRFQWTADHMLTEQPDITPNTHDYGIL